MTDHAASTDQGLVVSKDDKRLVDESVATITRLWRQGLLGTVVAVGDHLLEAFFDGILDLAAANQPFKPNALRHLYQRVEELPIGIHQLRLAIRIAAQWHLLPTSVADALTVSHHELLLLIEDQPQKERLAREAVANQLSVGALEKRIRKVLPAHRGGRPPSPRPIRWARALVRAVDAEEFAGALDDKELRSLSPEQRKALEIDLRKVRERIDLALGRFPATAKRHAPRG